MHVPLRLSPFAVAALVIACAGASPTSKPSTGPGSPPASQAPSQPPATAPAPSPTTIPVSQVTSAAQAAALVLASDPQFSSVGPLRADVVGQSAWYEAFDTGSGYTVTVTMGSGDCQSGCINKHTWTYSVATDGTIKLVSDEGDEIEGGGGPGTSDPATVNITLAAGPVCPVERVPPDPNCAPRPVANAEVILRDPAGSEVGRATSDASGHIALSLPGGAYYVEPQPADGLMGVAPPVAFSVVGGDSIGLLLEYDTGIR